MNDKKDLRVIITATDVDEAIFKDAELVWDGWFADEGRIDWEMFIDRLSDDYGLYGDPPYEFLEYDNPAIRKIQRFVRSLS